MLKENEKEKNNWIESVIILKERYISSFIFFIRDNFPIIDMFKFIGLYLQDMSQIAPS